MEAVYADMEVSTKIYYDWRTDYSVLGGVPDVVVWKDYVHRESQRHYFCGFHPYCT
jgi:hypothetical protein